LTFTQFWCIIQPEISVFENSINPYFGGLMAQSWTKQKVLDEIQAVYRSEGKINSSFIQKNHGYLYTAAVKRFGAWKDAVIAAGFDYQKIKQSEGNVRVFTHKKIIARIQEIYKAEGRLTSRFVQFKFPGLWGAAKNRFGNYGAAVTAAGFDYKKIKDEEHQKHVIWNPEKVKASLLGVYHAHNKLSQKFLKQHDSPLLSAAVKYFGTYAAAVKAAGIDYDDVRLGYKPLRFKGKRQIAREIRRRNKLGLPINSFAVYKQAGDLYHAATVYFPRPPWASALRFAGFDPKEVSPMNHWRRKPFLLQEIRNRFESGLPLYGSFIQKNCAGMYQGAARLFGSWRKAIEAAGLNYADIKKVWSQFWTKEKVIADIKALEAQGVRLSAKAMQTNHRPLFATATSLFGSWANAVEAAGINYLDHSILWLSRVWLKKLAPADIKKIGKKADVLSRLKRKPKRR
jgi:hypothetical protein